LQDEIKVGDVILYKKYAGTRIVLEDKDCVMLREAELDAVLS
jgi:co-chaperonin GroES (HSP10)